MRDQTEGEIRRGRKAPRPGRWKLRLLLVGAMWIAQMVRAAADSPYTVHWTVWKMIGNGVFVAMFFVFPAFAAGALYTAWAREEGRWNIFVQGPPSKRR